MPRIVMLLTAFALTLGPAAAQITGSLPAAKPTLRHEVTITSDLVRIGDLVDNAGAVAGTPIFRSPDIGETGAVEAYKVIDAVRAQGLTSLDTKGISEVLVTRAGRVVAVKDVEARVAEALARRFGLSDPKNLSLSFDQELRPLHLPPSATMLEPSRLFYDRRSFRFDVSFELAGSSAYQNAALRYSGYVIETREAAVLIHSLGKGDVVKQSDFQVERRPRAELGDDIPGAATDVVGLAARHPIAAGQPLRNSDLMKRDLVHRNEPVTLLYEMPGILLTVRGKAIESGGEGDLISVLNLQSNRTVQGTVSSDGRVIVGAIVPRLAATLAKSGPTDPTDSSGPRRE